MLRAVLENGKRIVYNLRTGVREENIPEDLLFALPYARKIQVCDIFVYKSKKSSFKIYVIDGINQQPDVIVRRVCRITTRTDGINLDKFEPE